MKYVRNLNRHLSVNKKFNPARVNARLYYQAVSYCKKKSINAEKPFDKDDTYGLHCHQHPNTAILLLE